MCIYLENSNIEPCPSLVHLPLQGCGVWLLWWGQPQSDLVAIVAPFCHHMLTPTSSSRNSTAHHSQCGCVLYRVLNCSSTYIPDRNSKSLIHDFVMKIYTNWSLHKIHVNTNDRASLVIQILKFRMIYYLNCSFLFPCMVCGTLGQTYWQEHKQD